MPDQWAGIALRFATYVDLTILFGVPLFAIQVLDPQDHATWISRRYARLVAAAGAIGIALALLGLAALALEMTGSDDVSAVTRNALATILLRTGAGVAWAARVGALGVGLIALAMLRNRPRTLFHALAVTGGIALATAGWAGHGAMDDGVRGYVHLGSDVLHLLAAGAWIGALAAFVFMSLAPPASDDHSVDLLNRTAAGFGRIGTAIVAILLVSGTINYGLIARANWSPLLSTLYGNLLIAKLAVFVLMLSLAGANRFLLGPRLRSALAAGDHAQAARTLVRSLRTEAALGLLVLALVAWLGVLSPET